MISPKIYYYVVSSIRLVVVVFYEGRYLSRHRSYVRCLVSDIRGREEANLSYFTVLYLLYFTPVFNTYSSNDSYTY